MNFKHLESMASGEYVLFLCSDDLILPNCLERAVAMLDENLNRGGVFYRAAHYGDDGLQFLSTLPQLEYADAERFRNCTDVSRFIYTAPSLCLYRRVTIQRLGGWNTDLQAVFDYELYSRVVRLGGGIAYLPEILAIIRLHDNRVSNTSALTWGFYHDLLILFNKPESSAGATYKAKAVAEQLLWDLRLGNDPKRTINHARNHGAWTQFCILLPYEIFRRIFIKLWIFGKKLIRLINPLKLRGIGPLAAERIYLDRFWLDITANRGTDARSGPSKESFHP
jgi:glycosyltransferase involved in cell wall biosynthesis